jgi:ABC-type methionine transport system permease subunit
MPETETPSKDEPLMVLIGYVTSFIVPVPLFLYLFRGEHGTRTERFHYLQATIMGVIMAILPFTVVLIVLWPIVYIYGLYIGYMLFSGKKDERPLEPYIGKYV